MSKKKLLIFHQTVVPYRIDQFNFLNQLFDLHVVFLFENYEAHDFDQSLLQKQLEFQYSFLLNGPNFGGQRVIRFGMFKKIREINPDIVIGYEYSITTQILILAKKWGLTEYQIGATVDDSIQICRNVQSKFREWARSFALKHLDFIVVLSHEVALYYQENFDLDAKQTIVSPILQRPSRLRQDKKPVENIARDYQKSYALKGKNVLLYVGRFAAEKGLLRFIKTIEPVLEQQDDLVLVFVGDGPEEEKLSDYAEKRNLKNKIFFPGRFEGNALFAWYLCASSFFLPSTLEPFGAVVNEALIFGLNVFCSKYAGSSTLINEDNGMIFDPLDQQNTRELFREFIDSILSSESPELKEKPAKIGFDETAFRNEWEKIENKSTVMQSAL